MIGRKRSNGSRKRRARKMMREGRGIRRDLFGLMAFLFGNRCLCCGKPYSKFIQSRRLSVDHVVPISLGGLYEDLRNLQPLCVECNEFKDKATTDYRPFIPTEEQLWAAVGKEKRCVTGRSE